jgi:hypothetical protein
MQVVSVDSRQLLVLEPFVMTDTLMPALQAAGVGCATLHGRRTQRSGW